MTTEDEELCSRAVKATPKRTAINGFESPSRKLMKAGLWESGAIAALTIVMPTKSMPKPRMTMPM